MRFDLLIRDGDVIDPATGHSGRLDVAVTRGRIAAVDESIPTESAARTIDAGGLLVAPGLIDLHAHVFHGVGYFGTDADHVASRSGVTTWVDAGSAGAFTLPGFRRFIVEPSTVRILAFLNVSYLGLVGLNYDEFHDIATCDVDLLERAVAQHSDIVVGIKVRMGTGRVGNQGLEPLRLARRAAERLGLPLMVHIADAPPPLADVVAMLEPGDIVTHAFTGLSQGLVDDAGEVRPEARRLQADGIRVDIGHGSGSFSFRSAEALTNAGIWPDTISSDLHQVSQVGPNLLDPLAQDIVARVRGDGSLDFTLLTVMTKFLHLGMALADVVAAVTSRPAAILGLADEIGTLRVGARADIALLHLAEGSFELVDIHGLRRTATRRFEHDRTIVAGRVLPSIPAPELPPWIQPLGEEAARL